MQEQTVILGVQTLMVARVRRDPELQVRLAMHVGRVDEFAAAMREGVVFPPIVVFYDGCDVWLSDGFHRITAALRAGREVIEADVRAGGQLDALVFAFFANATHGEPLRPQERKAALRRIIEAHLPLKHGDGVRLAKQLGVSEAVVSRQARAISAERETLHLQDSASEAGSSWDGTGGAPQWDGPGAPVLTEAEPSPFWAAAAAAAAARVEAEQDALEGVLEAAGGNEDTWQRARELARYSALLKEASELLFLDPERIAAMLPEERQVTARSFCTACLAWCARFERAMGRPLQLV